MAINLTAPLVACHAAAPHLKAAGGGRILNVSSVAALLPIPGLMSYGISKIGLEHLTVDLARILQADGVAVNCFRIDLAVASEGFIANTPGVDRSTWEPCEVAAEGVLWMLQQPASLLRPPREHGRASASARGSWRAGPRSRSTTAHRSPTLFDGVAPDTEPSSPSPTTDASLDSSTVESVRLVADDVTRSMTRLAGRKSLLTMCWVARLSQNATEPGASGSGTGRRRWSTAGRAA